MNYFVFGYADKKCSQGHKCLYAGTSRSEALVALKQGGAGCETTQLFASPMPSQTVRHGERARRLAQRFQQAEPESLTDSDLSPQGEESVSPQEPVTASDAAAETEPALPLSPAEENAPAPAANEREVPAATAGAPLPLPEKPGKKK